MLDYPSWAVDAIVAIAALPVTFAVLWMLLRSPIGERLVAVPSDERWHEQPTPTFGGVGIFAGFIGGILLWIRGAMQKGEDMPVGDPFLREGLEFRL